MFGIICFLVQSSIFLGLFQGVLAIASLKFLFVGSSPHHKKASYGRDICAECQIRVVCANEKTSTLTNKLLRNYFFDVLYLYLIALLNFFYDFCSFSRRWRKLVIMLFSLVLLFKPNTNKLIDDNDHNNNYSNNRYISIEIINSEKTEST